MARCYGTTFERFIKKITVSLTEQWNGTPCWNWNDKPNKGGYGMLNIANRARLAHRISFRIFKQTDPGPILDHLCRNRRCVNPDHLESVDPFTNFDRGEGREGLRIGRDLLAAVNRSKTHCPIGHAYDKTNTAVRRDGSRRCRACHRLDRSRKEIRCRQASRS